MEFATNFQIQPAGSGQQNAPTKRLWQSLVLPLVLGCVIFLVALWTRQMSLALTDDTIVMMMILMAVFIIMSGVAFWLSCDQHFQAIQQQQQHHHQSHGEDELAARAREQSASGLHTYCQHCQLHRANQGGGESSSNNPTGHHPLGAVCPAMWPMRDEGTKCTCAISMIDCQPPDYYSALRDSSPIHHSNNHLYFQRFGCPSQMVVWAQHAAGEEGQQQQQQSGDNLKELYLLPPSYEELQMRRNSVGTNHSVDLQTNEQQQQHRLGENEKFE